SFDAANEAMLEEMVSAGERAVTLCQGLHDADESDHRARDDLARALTDLSRVRIRQGASGNAVKLAQDAVRWARQDRSQARTNTDYRLTLALALEQLGEASREFGENPKPSFDE